MHLTPGSVHSPAERLVGRDITVVYGARAVLDGVSIEIDKGARVALVGPSGSGKTTLLSILGGLQQPDSGGAHVEHPGEVLPAPEFVAWVLQTTNGLGRRTVLDNVMLGTLTQQGGFAERAARSIAALETVNLAGFETRQARSLSGGELQRVAIARAIAADRPFILADEPTGQLDRASTATVLDALFNVASDRAIVVATHDPQVWERCGVAYHLDNGRLIEGRDQ